MIKTPSRQFWWLLALLVLLAFAFQGSRGIWEPDEGRYCSAGINMLRSGDWLVPSIDSEHPHLTKPPVTYWALGASFALLGANEWAARLPAALAFIGTGLFMFGLGRRFCAAKPWLPPLVWGLSFAPFFAANVVSTDALLMFFETAAMYAFVEAWCRGRAADTTLTRGWIRLMWLAWGIAFLTKGPPGLLPLLGMTIFLGAHDRRRLRGLFDVPGLLIFAVTAFTWFALIIRQDPGRLQYFLGYEVYDRVFTGAHHRNSAWYGGLVVYLPMLVIGTLPWSVMALVAAGGVRTAWGRLRDRVAARDASSLLLLYWFGVPFAVFMLARSRLPLYVMPLFVPLSLAFARALAGWAWLTPRRLGTVMTVTAAALIAGKGVLAHHPIERDSRDMATAVRSLVDPRQFDGITFVDMRPFYGLNVYLGRPVKSVPMTLDEGESSAYGPGEDLCTELARPRRTLYAMKEKREADFLGQVQLCNRATPARVGRFEADGNRIVLYTVPR